MKNKILILSCSCLLSGCLGHQTGTSDLKKFIATEQAKTPPTIDPVPEFTIIPQYQYSHGKDPFSPVKEFIGTNVIDPLLGKNNNLPDEVRNHPPEELEDFSLDSLSMQGTLKLKGIDWVLIQDSDGTLHRVRIGNYMGKHMGRIVKISEEKIVLAEYYMGINGYERRKIDIVLEGL